MSLVIISIEGSRLNSSFPEVACPTCRTPLNLHQPDQELPDKLLGVCLECKAWVLIDSEIGVMALLPNRIVLRKA